MKKLTHIIIIIPIAFFCYISPGTARTDYYFKGLCNVTSKNATESCNLTLEDGTKIDRWAFRLMHEKHIEWLNTDGNKGEQIHLEKADLSNICFPCCDLLNLLQKKGPNLRKATMLCCDLSNADISYTNLSDADLRGSNLIGANLLETDLKGADLRGVNFNGADLRVADLRGADLSEANLTGANLRGADLRGAKLIDVEMKDANLGNADLSSAIFELKQQSLPYVPYLTTTRSLSELTYNVSPHSLIELRELFKLAGLRKQEQEITYAIKHTEFIQAFTDNNSRNFTEHYNINNLEIKIFEIIKLIAFSWTCKWGLSPLRPLLILTVFIFVFSLIYFISIIKTEKKDGIWKIWPENRIRQDIGQKKQELLTCKGWLAIRYSLHFSMLSAFHIGWRDLNVGNWLTRLQLHEYTLQATGSMKVFSGIQSIISVYMLILWFLSTFSRWFQT